MATCANDGCRRKFVGDSCPYCNKSKNAKKLKLDESVFGTSETEYVNIEDLQRKTTVEIHGDYVQNIDNSSKNELNVGGDYLDGNAIKADDSTILSKPSTTQKEHAEVRFKFCPYCKADFRTLLSQPIFCPTCGKQLGAG